MVLSGVTAFFLVLTSKILDATIPRFSLLLTSFLSGFKNDSQNFLGDGQRTFPLLVLVCIGQSVAYFFEIEDLVMFNGK
jgi:hypothetical protein